MLDFFQLNPHRVFKLVPFHISRSHKPRPLSSCIMYRCVKGPNYNVCVFHTTGAAGLTLNCGFSPKGYK